MQALYAYFQDSKHDMNAAERELFRGIEKSYDLYLTMLQLLIELVVEEDKYVLDKPKSKLSPGRIIKPKNLLSDNLFLQTLCKDKNLAERLAKRKISWQQDHDAVLKIFHQIKKSPVYLNERENEVKTWPEEVEYALKIYQDFIGNYDFILNLLEEKNIYFAESLDFINSMVVKCIKAASRKETGTFELYDIFRDEEDDRDFVKNLFNDTISNEIITEKYIAEKSTNWDIDRIALLDVIILKMAISEIVRFSSIPVKVSINEYIDLSKEYSTPKSSNFVNGVLDKIVMELKEQGKVVKMGRGLIE